MHFSPFVEAHKTQRGSTCFPETNILAWFDLLSQSVLTYWACASLKRKLRDRCSRVGKVPALHTLRPASNF